MKTKAYFLVFDGLADWELAEADAQLWFDMFKHGVLPASDAV